MTYIGLRFVTRFTVCCARHRSGARGIHHEHFFKGVLLKTFQPPRLWACFLLDSSGCLSDSRTSRPYLSDSRCVFHRQNDWEQIHSSPNDIYPTRDALGVKWLEISGVSSSYSFWITRQLCKSHHLYLTCDWIFTREKVWPHLIQTWAQQHGKAPFFRWFRRNVSRFKARDHRLKT